MNYSTLHNDRQTELTAIFFVKAQILSLCYILKVIMMFFHVKSYFGVCNVCI